MEVFAYKLSGLSWTEVSGVEQQRNVINSCEDKQKSNISFPTVQCTVLCCENRIPDVYSDKSQRFQTPKTERDFTLLSFTMGSL